MVTANINTLKRRLIADNIDFSHIKSSNKGRTFSVKRRPIDELLVKDSHVNRYHLKQRLVQEGILKNCCHECGNTGTWNKKPLSLQLEHKNGDGFDNRIENLCLLCPNCHSQTPTFAGRKRRKIRNCNQCGSIVSKGSPQGRCRRCASLRMRKVQRPDSILLRKQVEDLGFEGTGRIYGVSGNAIRKWLKASVV